MIVIMKSGAGDREIAAVVNKLKRLGFGIHLSRGEEKTIIGAIGGDRKALAEANIEAFPFVDRITPITKSYKLASREWKPEDTVVNVGDVRIGGDEICVIAGPCSVESRELLIEAAGICRDLGAQMLRGGAYKPRTSPYSFQGMEEEGLRILAEARERTGLGVCTEVMEPARVPLVSQYADILQIGTRNMQNYPLLRACGRQPKPVMLKRGFSSTIDEWLQAAEYIMNEGNYGVILCERGIRTYETATRFTLDLNAVPLLKQLTHLPVFVDPSHGTGKRSLVTAMARAAIAAGADGLLVETHQRPEEAISDAAQTISPDQLGQMMREISAIAAAIGRGMPTPVVMPREATAAW